MNYTFIPIDNLFFFSFHIVYSYIRTGVREQYAKKKKKIELLFVIKIYNKYSETDKNIYLIFVQSCFIK